MHTHSYIGKFYKMLKKKLIPNPDMYMTCDILSLQVYFTTGQWGTFNHDPARPSTTEIDIVKQATLYPGVPDQP